MNPIIHDKVSALLHKVSRDIILPHYRSLTTEDIKEKSPGDLVTIADKLSEQILSEHLVDILPQAKIVGEEAASTDPAILSHLSSEQCWIIDPIDGTGNYARGDGAFGVIIALAENNETVAGWIYDPIKERLCHAIRGGGAFIDNEAIYTPTEASELPLAAIATGYMSDKKREQTLQKAEGNYQIVPIPMCAAEQYPLLALGQHHISIFERTLAWDHAAGILFLNEAGGKAARWDGSAYHPADKESGLLGASSPQLWDAAAEHFAAIHQ